ncbi:MAG: hypothetical protein JXQ96_21445 [Cyclobacteriaceae bacterium]
MRTEFKKWLFVVLAFMLFFYLYSLFSYFGIKDFIQEDSIQQYFESHAWHLEILIAGILFGTLFIAINLLTEIKVLRKKSFGFIILFKTTLYIISLSVIMIVIFHLFSMLDLIGDEVKENINAYLSVKLLSSFFIYSLLFVLIISFIMSVSRKFGPELMLDLLTGKYYHPRGDELVFLFLDLEDSTRIAEKLGHNIYSRFIKECIHELTPVILKYKARVYQYVGDEVILYWNVKTGISRLNCLNSFFAFAEILRKQESYFKTKYGEIPKFKGGMDAGTVTLTEIGDVKREIAFHGDVLNTASRLEKKCKEFSEYLIVSQHVLDHVSGNEKYNFKLLSDLPLRGKTESLNFYSVDPA